MTEPGISLHGIIIIDIFGLVFIAFILHLVRTHKLYVSYAIIWLSALAILMITVSIPPFLNFVTKAVGAILSASALSLLGFIFIFLVLVSISVQLSALSARQIKLIQYLALKELQTEEDNPIKDNG